MGDGRYLEDGDGESRITVIEIEGALPPARRRRRKPRPAGERQAQGHVPVTVVTVVLPELSFDTTERASEWLGTLSPDSVDDILEEGLAALDRLLATAAAATGRPWVRRYTVDDLLASRIGYATGTGASEGIFSEAVEVDARGGTAAPRRERISRSRPLRRIAAVLRGREPLRTCEVLIPRVASDLDAGRTEAAAAVITPAVRLTISELDGALEDDQGHDADLDELRNLLPGLEEATGGIGTREPVPGRLELQVGEAVAIAERAIRRVRLLDP